MSKPKWYEQMTGIAKMVIILCTLVGGTAAWVARGTVGQVKSNTSQIEFVVDEVGVLQSEVLDLGTAIAEADTARARADTKIVCLLTDAKDATPIEARSICGAN